MKRLLIITIILVASLPIFAQTNGQAVASSGLTSNLLTTARGTILNYIIEKGSVHAFWGINAKGQYGEGVAEQLSLPPLVITSEAKGAGTTNMVANFGVNAATYIPSGVIGSRPGEPSKSIELFGLAVSGDLYKLTYLDKILGMNMASLQYFVALDLPDDHLTCLHETKLLVGLGYRF